MISRILKNNTLYPYRYHIFVSALLAGLYFTNYVDIISGNDIADLNDLLFFTYSHLDINSIDKILPVLIWTLPNILLIYVLGHSMRNDFDRIGVYIFTRTKNRMNWVLSNSFKLFVKVCGFYIVHFMVVVIIGIINGYRIASYSDLMLFMQIFSIQILLSYLLVYITNLLSFFIDAVYSNVVFFALYFFSIMVSHIVNKYFTDWFWLIKWLPFSQSLLSLHDAQILKSIQFKYALTYIEGFSISFSYVYILSLFSLLLTIFLFKLKKVDII